MLRLAIVLFAVFLSSCARTSQAARQQVPGEGKRTKRTEAAGATVRPAGKGLGRAQAEQRILALINQHRASEGLPPVKWDPIAAKAGQRHAEDMARQGFTAHWGTDGSVPEQRYTEAGGQHMVQENAGCFGDNKERELDPSPSFDPTYIEKMQNAFFYEKPPADGHRKNILRSWHTHVGVGLAKAKGSNVVCMAQEFTDIYGQYEELPKSASARKKIRVAGKVNSPAKFIGVSVANVPTQRKRTAQELSATNTYAIPQPSINYFPKGFVTPIPVTVQGDRFSIEFPIDASGLHEISVWGKVPGSKDHVMISLRTIQIR